MVNKYRKYKKRHRAKNEGTIAKNRRCQTGAGREGFEVFGCVDGRERESGN
jgi:hypothetical protein